MEILLLSYYLAPNNNLFKTFLISEDCQNYNLFYLVSTLNDRITIVKSLCFKECCDGSRKDSYKQISLKLAFAPEYHFTFEVRIFFEKNHKLMFKTAY